MKDTADTIIKKIALLDEVCTDSILEDKSTEIIKNFADASIEILEADFAFVSWKSLEDGEYKILYKNSGAPANLSIQNKLENTLTIPVHYGDHVFGNIVVGYKNKRNFTEEQHTLSKIIGSVAAQAVTIPWLIENERKTLVFTEKQKEIETLLSQEKSKTEFIENATHELRTPLAIMKGNVDLALLGKKNLKLAIETLESVNSEIKTLAEILQSLAIITASGRNAAEMISLEPINLLELIQNTATRLKPIAKKKNITINVHSKTADLTISGDKIYLEKLFINLIKNSITYGRNRGSTKIELSEDKNTALIEIKDDGIGISKEDLPKIFERFYRADKAHSAVGTHSGLGLAIVKWVAEVHGGTIDVKSTKGKGSVFTVTLPLKKS